MQKRAFILATGLFLTWINTASANIVFNLSNVTTYGGSVTGSFTTNDALDTLISWDITTPASGDFHSFEYSNATTGEASGLPYTLSVRDASTRNRLTINFYPPLSATGTTLSISSSEIQFASASVYSTRKLTGSVVAEAAVTPPVPAAGVPEPASVALLLAGLTGVSLLRRRGDH